MSREPTQKIVRSQPSSSTTNGNSPPPPYPSVRLQAKILIPLLTSIAFGLMSTTLLIILVVPAFYAILEDFGLTSLAAERRHAAA